MNSGMFDRHSEFRVWQSKLYELQRQAPAPHLIPCLKRIFNRPPQYGLEYHGPVSRQETEKLLESAPNGAYLIRESQRAANAYTLVIWFDGSARNYKLFYDPNTKQHYVGEKRFDTVECLVADGLIHFNIETHGADVLEKISEAKTYEKTPFYKMRYHTFNTNELSSSLNALLEKSAKVCAGTPQSVEFQADDLLENDRASKSSGLIPVCENDSRRLKPVESNYSRQQKRNMRISSPPSLSDWTGVFNETRMDSESSHSRSHGFTQVGEPVDSTDPHGSSDSDLAIPPVPPPRSSSGSGFLTRSILPSSDCYTSNHRLGSKALITPKSDRITVYNPTFLHASADTNAGPLRLEHIPEGLNPPASSTLSDSLDEDPADRPCSSASSSGSNVSPPTDSACSASPLSSISTQWWPPTFSKPDGPLTSVSNFEASNGTDKQAAINLLERYKLPAVCLATDQSVLSDSLTKKHNFKVHTYRGPHWCDFCTHFIWGLVAQGVKCTDCGFQAHKRCSDRVPDDCLPDIKHMKRVFGIDLINLTIAERKPIPTILERCIAEIERRGALETEGLYRIPGNHDRIEQLRASFDKDCESAPISVSRVPDVNVITSLIKSFLRQLPVPLITYEAYPKLIEIVRNESTSEEEKLHEIATVLSSLPPAHYESLRFFLRHIHRVAENCDKNMMPVENLCVVLTPSLMNSNYTDPIVCMIGMQTDSSLVFRLIKNYTRLFPVSSSPLRRNMTCDPGSGQQMEDTCNQPTVRSSPLAAQKRSWFLRYRHSVDTSSNLLSSSTGSQTSSDNPQFPMSPAM